MQTLSFDVSGMTCGGCTGSVQRALSKIDGVSRVEVSLHPGTALVVIDPERVTSAQIEGAITGVGYPAKARPAAHGAHAPS
jgi:copper chaperone